MLVSQLCAFLHACVTISKKKIALFEGGTFPELLQTILESANFHESLLNPVTNLCCSVDRP